MSKTKHVEIISKIEIFNKLFFKIEEARLRYERFDGSMSKTLTRLNLQRGDAVAAVIHDPQQDTVTLVEQFRYSTYDNGPGWLLEIPAGMVEADDSDPAARMHRELREEIGYQAADLQLITMFYPSPGGSSERIYVYYAQVSAQDKVAAGGGIAAENENIRIVTLNTAEALEKLTTGEIMDGKTIIGLQWLQLRQA